MTYTLKIGQVLDKRFKITDLIRKGGTTSNYEAIVNVLHSMSLVAQVSK